MRPPKPITLAALASTLLGLFFAYAFYIRYWRWRDCIAAAESSCTEPGAWNATTGGALWSVPALFFFAAALVLCAVRVWSRRRSSKV